MISTLVLCYVHLEFLLKILYKKKKKKKREFSIKKVTSQTIDFDLFFNTHEYPVVKLFQN